MALTHAASALASGLAGPREISHLYTEPSINDSCPLEACVVCLSTNSIVIKRVPTVVHSERPMEVELTVPLGGISGCSGAAVAWGRAIAAHTLMAISYEQHGHHPVSLSAELAVRPSASGWIGRALIHPASWKGASYVTINSLTCAGWHVGCDILPAIVRVGYNHASAPGGAVIDAARAQDVAALQAALNTGGSTEEVDVASGLDDAARTPAPHSARSSSAARLHTPLLGRLQRLPRWRPHSSGSRRQSCLVIGGEIRRVVGLALPVAAVTSRSTNRA